MAKFRDIFSKVKVFGGATVVLGIVIFVVFIGSFVVVIDAGQVGVVSTFGKVSEKPMESGIHLKNPFSQIIKLDARTRSYTMSSTYYEGEVKGDDSIQALTSDGGSVWLDVTVLYKLDVASAPSIYKNLGTTFEENIVRPEIRTVIRSKASMYPVNELYSAKREEFQNAVLTDFQTSLKERGIIVEDVLIRKVNISDQLSQSIEQKLAAEQEVQKFDFEIQKSQKEAERQRVEAEGQKVAQDIINSSLTEKYLYYVYLTNLQDRQGTIYVPTEGGVPLFKNIE